MMRSDNRLLSLASQVCDNALHKSIAVVFILILLRQTGPERKPQTQKKSDWNSVNGAVSTDALKEHTKYGSTPNVELL